jgi:hypothetical protein
MVSFMTAGIALNVIAKMQVGHRCFAPRKGERAMNDVASVEVANTIALSLRRVHPWKCETYLVFR